MVRVAEACEECVLNCQVMHKKDRNPSPKPTATTFFKVMIGDDFTKIMYLPSRFARRVRKKVGMTTKLETFNGDKFEVNITKVDGKLAFQTGWSEFVSAHGLKVGDLLVFHYVMDENFVVLMYGSSGCPELRHYQMETTQNNTCDRFSHESSSQPKKRIKEKKTDASMPNTHNQLFASSQPGTSGSDKEKTSLKSKPLCNNTDPDKGVPLADNDNGNDDNMVFETPIEKGSGLVGKDNGNIEDEGRKKDGKVKSDESGSARKTSAGGGVEIKNNELRNKIEKRILEKQKGNTVMPSEATRSNFAKRSRDVDVSATVTKIAKKEHETLGSNLHNGGCLPASNGILPRPEATPVKITKKEPVTLDSNLPNGRYSSIPTANCSKPIAKREEPMEKNPKTNHGSDGSKLKNTKTANVNSRTKESGNNSPEVKVKPEPVDDDEPLPSRPINTFSAVMSSHQYLELPANVKLGSAKSSSTVIFLKNGDQHLWPVLYQTKLGLKALTQSWGTFARETGIQLGDKCVFVPEKQPNVFTVHHHR